MTAAELRRARIAVLGYFFVLGAATATWAPAGTTAESAAPKPAASRRWCARFRCRPLGCAALRLELPEREQGLSP